VGSQFDMFFKIVEHIDIVSRSTPFFLEIKSQKKVPKILANIYSSTCYGIHKKIFPRDRAILPSNSRAIPLPIPSQFSEKGTSHSPIPIPSGFKGMNSAEKNHSIQFRQGFIITV